MEEIIYRGIALPTENDQFPNIKEEKDLIRDSIITILMTKIGQRLFVPDFGSNLWSLVFEQNNSVLQKIGDRYVREALKTWEPRITIDKVDFYPNLEENLLTIFITYRIIRINEIQNMTLDISRDSFVLQSSS